MFDAYHKWLGIPPKDQPPNHYRLLGLELFEADRDVIGNAADQRMMLVRSFQSGENYQFSQQLLNEIAAARICLLSPLRKSEYDHQLRKTQGIDIDSGSMNSSVQGNSDSPRVMAATKSVSQKQIARKRSPLPIPAAWLVPLSLATLFFLGLIGVILLRWLSEPNNSGIPATSVVSGTSTRLHAGATPVTASPAPLELQAVPIQILPRGGALSVRIRARVSSAPFNNLQFLLAADAPRGMTIAPDSGALAWIPTDVQGVGRYSIRVLAVDGKRKAETTFDVIVEKEAASLRIKPIAEQSVVVGSKLRVKVEFEPSDTALSSLKYSLESGPMGSAVDPANGEFIWQPDSESAGQTLEAKIRVAGAAGGNAETSFTIKVAQQTPSGKLPAPPGAEGTAGRRLPIPGLADQNKALEVIRQLFGELYAKARTSSAERRKLAERLIEEADNTRDDAVGQYVLYVEAADQAQAAGDIKLLVKSIDSMAGLYAVEGTNLKQERLIELSKTTIRNEVTARDLTQALLDCLSERIKRDEWKDATSVVKAANVSATKSRDAELRKHVAQRSREVAALTKAYSERTGAVEALALDRGDAAGNRTVGLYDAFVRDDWEVGVKHLAKGDDAGLATAARKELSQPTTLEDKKEIADAWLAVLKGRSGDAAVKRLLDSSPTARDHVRKHALAWYNLALAEATGLAKRAIEQQISELQAADQRELGSAGPCKGGFSQILDNPSANFVGAWSSYPSLGYGNDFRHIASGNGSSTATYQFTGLTPGQFKVFATWVEAANRGTNVPYSINGGGSPTTVAVNQQVAPSADATAAGRPFKLLGTATVTGSTLTIALSNNANGTYVIADAVRIECKR